MEPDRRPAAATAADGLRLVLDPDLPEPPLDASLFVASAAATRRACQAPPDASAISEAWQLATVLEPAPPEPLERSVLESDPADPPPSIP